MKPDWKDAPEGAKILVQQDDGVWFFGSYEKAVPSENGGWDGIGEGCWFASLAIKDSPRAIWEDTLERRPSGIETPEEKEELDRIQERMNGESIKTTIGTLRSKYHAVIKGVQIDVYDVLKAFNVTNPGDQHAIKKMLKAGQRGYKDANQDREEAIASLKRAIELEEE